jgi:CTP:molybdopterin cytidylyltransferase MocA
MSGLRQTPAETAPQGYSSNALAANGRLIVLAIDQPNIRAGGVRSVVAALDQFIDRLSASDRLAMVAFGRGTPAIPFTADRERVKQAIARITGQMEAPPLPVIRMSLPAASLLLRGDEGTRQALMRLCLFSGPNQIDECETAMVTDANNLLRLATEQRDDSIRALMGVLNALKGIDAPKSLLLVSEGLPLLSDETDMAARFEALGTLAGKAAGRRRAVACHRTGTDYERGTGGDVHGDGDG